MLVTSGYSTRLLCLHKQFLPHFQVEVVIARVMTFLSQRCCAACLLVVPLLAASVSLPLKWCREQHNTCSSLTLWGIDTLQVRQYGKGGGGGGGGGGSLLVTRQPPLHA